MAAESLYKSRRHVDGGGPASQPVVWVGSLSTAVTEQDLYNAFLKAGKVESCKIMRDESGASRGFAYITYFLEEHAEAAASMYNGFKFYGSAIKTKGPSVLREEGHIPRSPRSSQQDNLDYRPYTDCSFFVQGNKCTKGKSCPYRHSVKAKESSYTCPDWKAKNCLDMDCPYKHPGNKGETVGSREDGGQELLVCGGKCRLSSCQLSFSSRKALEQHVEESQQLKCPYCSSVGFQSDSDYIRHLQSCYNDQSRQQPGSSPGEEVLELDPPDSNMAAARSNSDSSHKTSGSGSDDQLVAERRRSHSGSEAIGGRGHLPQQQQQRDPLRSSSAASDEINMAELDYYLEDSEEEDEVIYSSGEIARLLSLNERDMQEDDDEDNDTGEGEEETSVKVKVEEEWETGGIREGSHGSATTRNDAPPPPPSKKKPASSPAHARAKEPVGVFWDIENCSVPMDRSAFAVASKFRKEFISGKREAEFMCVCDITKERKEVVDDLNKAQVTLVHVNAVAKNAADDKLRQSLRRFANTYPPPASLVLISGDVNFSTDVNDLVNCHGLTVILVHNTQASEALKAFASRLVNFDEFIVDVGPPSRPQNPSDLPRVVAVRGLPKHVPSSRLFSILGRLSDNCGGKVLKVDMNTGTAKILFRTNDWASKALKRMNNEDVFGAKISTSLEMEPNPPAPPNGGRGNFQHLAGPALGKSFPPSKKLPASQLPGPSHRTPPMPARHMQQQPPFPHSRAPQMPFPPRQPLLFPPAPFQQAMIPGHPQQQHPPLHGPPPHLMHPNARPQMLRGPVGRPMPLRPGAIHPAPMMGHPVSQPPPMGGVPLPLQPHISRPAIPLLTSHQVRRFKQPPCLGIKDLPKGSIPRVDGRILVFKVPPDQEPHMEQNVVALLQDAFFSAQHRVLWHSYSEIQVVFKLDFVQTAIIRKEEIIQELYQKGNLPIKIAEEFVETCTKSIADVLRRHNCQWEVTMCGWTSEEEENRITRSNALTVLRSRQPLTWINFAEFKKLYQQRYNGAISELAIHSACTGALQILSSSGNSSSKNQVVIVQEFSPLVKVVNDPKLHDKLMMNFCRLLSMQPQKKLKLLDFVLAYRNSNLGPLPLSPSGKILQDVLTSTPNVELEGGEPANTYVVLKQSGAVRREEEGRSKKPRDLAGLVANFHQLIMSRGTAGISTRTIQQDYQTFFHHSFRISDYLGEGNNMQDLLKQVPGIKVTNVILPDGTKEKIVFLDKPEVLSSKAAPSSSVYPPQQKQQAQQQAPPGTKVGGASGSLGQQATASVPASPGPPSPSKRKPLSEVNDNFRKLLMAAPGRLLPFNGFQQNYQTFFHTSFRVSSYMSGGDVRMKDLVEACPGVKFIMFKNDKYVCLAEEAEALQTKDRASAASPTDKLSEGDIREFRRQCVLVLNSVDGLCLLAQFPEHYIKLFGRKFQPSDFKAKKLLQLLELIAENVEVYDDNRKMKLINQVVDQKRKCEEDLVMLIYGQGDHTISLDRLMSVYASTYGHKLDFHGYPRLLKLLESFSSTLKITGSGCDRPITLMPLQLFSCEMMELLPHHSAPMPINKIVPSYKEHFNRDLQVQQYGFPKLIKLLEALPELLEIKGSGATRTVSLRHRTVPLVSRVSPFEQQSVADAICALLLGTHTQKLSVPELLNKYNEIFGRGVAQLRKEELLDVVCKSQALKVVGSGPASYVHLEPGSAGPVSPLKAALDLEEEPGSSPSGQKKKKKASDNLPPHNDSDRSPELLGKFPGASSMAAVATPGFEDQPGGEDEANYSSDTESTSSSSSWMEEGDEGKRMVNETRRLLLLHQEHAMTLMELVDSFQTQEDPGNISVQILYRYLKTEAASKKFQISEFPHNLGVSMVQLNSKDCLWKLGEDLLQLFVYRPTPDLCHPFSSLPVLYQECYSRKLVTAVYSAKDLDQVLRSKVLKGFIHVDPVTRMCSPSEACKVQVLVSLMIELLYFKGDECASESQVPRAYSLYFGARMPLEALNLNNVSELFQLPRMQQFIKCITTKAKKLKPVLKPRAVFVEQIRHLLTVHDGHFSLRQFGDHYTAEFGKAESEEIAILLRKGRLPRYGMNVVNYSSLKWAVWAPNAYPVPAHRQVVKRAPVPMLNLSDQNHRRQAFDYDAIQREASSVIDSIDSLQDPEVITTLPSNLPGPSTEKSSSASYSRREVFPVAFEKKFDSAAAPQSTTNVDSSRLTFPHLSTEMADSSSSFVPSALPDLETNTSSTTAPSLSDVCKPPGSSVPPQTVGAVDEDDTNILDDAESGMLAVAYDFIKNDPELLARLSEKPKGTMAAFLDTSSMPEEDVRIVTEALNLQQLQDLPKQSSQGGDPPGVSSHKTEEKGASSEVSVPLPVESTIGGTSHGETAGCPPLGAGPVDFFEQGLAPEQVLDELWKLKKDSGGSIKLDQMTPFLDYFGELSSRELDRVEKLEAQTNPQKKAGNGESRRKKRNMAIRFPSQSKATVPPPNLYKGKELSLSDFGVPVGKLPEANFDLSSDESGEEGDIKPFNREEFIREALEKKSQEFEIPVPSDGAGSSSQFPTDSFLSSADLSNLSKLNSAVSDLESFLQQDSQN